MSLNPEDYRVEDAQKTKEVFEELTKICFSYARDNGFRDKEIQEADHRFEAGIALAHSMLSECLETFRKKGAEEARAQFDKWFSECKHLTLFLDGHLGDDLPKEQWWFATRIALMHSELSEAMDASINGNPPSNKIPGFSHIEEELADVLIRIFDEAGAMGLDIGGAVLAKIDRNSKRPYRHGKKV